MKKWDLNKIIDGKKIAKEVLSELAVEVDSFRRDYRPPKLAVIIVGEDPASEIYVGMKVRASAKCGIDSDLVEMASDISEEYLLERLKRLNSDPGIDGILVQLPLPAHIDKQNVIERISPDKDVDGFHPYNLGRILSDKPRFIPCTPLGIQVLISKYGVKAEGRNVVIVGRSLIVGKPMAMLLSAKSNSGNATVTICHSRTKDLSRVTVKADILIAAVGKANMITGDMVKGGVVVIDVGVNRVDDPETKRGYRLEGDVDFDSVQPKASLITPVPGGVGPMTVAMLMQNTLQAARWARGESDDRQ